jgi:hypothetical protein
MKIGQHYPNRKSLAQADPVYKEALEILNTLYMEAPAAGTNPLSSKDVVDYYMMSCVHTIVDKLTEEVFSFPSILNECSKRTFVETNSDNMSFENFYVNADYEHTALYGAVYYVLAVQQRISHKYLNYIEKLFAPNTKLKAYFLPFKEAAEKATKQHLNEDAHHEDVVETNLRASDGKRIVLAERRNSDFTRIVQAMISDGYFRHADKSSVTATEVGEMMLKLVGVGTEWKSMLQKAFSRDNPMKTFDNLRDAAQSYWSGRAHLKD